MVVVIEVFLEKSISSYMTKYILYGGEKILVNVVMKLVAQFTSETFSSALEVRLCERIIIYVLGVRM